MTQKEYMEKIKENFQKYIMANRTDFRQYDYRNNKAIEHIRKFKSAVTEEGLSFSKCYHENGIGNNNEYQIFLSTRDNEGYFVDKKIAEFYYCEGIFGGITIMLTDLAEKERVFELHYAR